MLKVLDHLEEWLIAFLMGGATLIIFAAVTHRYALDLSAKYHFDAVYDALFSINTSWAQELCIYMFVWMAKFGAAYGVRTGIHVGVDVLINRFDDRVRGKLIIFGLLAGALFTATIAVMGGRFIWENGMHYAVLNALGLDTGDLPEGPTTPDLEWPTWFVYSAIPLGSSLMCFRFLQVAWAFMRTGELPHHDFSHVEGLHDGQVPIDVNPYDMDDNLHMHDLKHRQVGDAGADKGKEGGQ
jgi:C4-dicarboxylate transporter DctQ subunit